MKQFTSALGFALAFLSVFGEMSRQFKVDVCLRQDLRPLAEPLLDCLSSLAQPSAIAAALVMILATWRLRGRLPFFWLPACGLLWLFANDHGRLILLGLTLWLVTLGVALRRDGATWPRLFGLLAGAALMELTLAGRHGLLYRFLWDYCFPDPLRAFLLCLCLASACLCLMRVGMSGKLSLLPLAFLMTLPALLWSPPLAPEEITHSVIECWESPHKIFRPDTRITFPTSGFRSNRRSALKTRQIQAIQQGNLQLHQAVWDAVLATKPLSLRTSTSELAAELLLRPEKEQLKNYLSGREIKIESQQSRVTFSGKIKNASWPAADLPLRVVTASEAGGLLNRNTQLSKVTQTLWTYRDESDFLLSSLHSISTRTDQSGHFEFKNLPPTNYSLLVGVAERDELSAYTAWMPFLLRENTEFESEISYSPLLEEPQNLDFGKPLHHSWVGRFSDELEEGIVHSPSLKTVKLIAGAHSHAGILQKFDARSLRKKRVRVRLQVLEMGRPLGYDGDPAVNLTLRTSNSDFETGVLKGGIDTPTHLEVIHELPAEAELLSISVWTIGQSHAVLGGIEFEVLP